MIFLRRLIEKYFFSTKLPYMLCNTIFKKILVDLDKEKRILNIKKSFSKYNENINQRDRSPKEIRPIFYLGVLKHIKLPIPDVNRPFAKRYSEKWQSHAPKNHQEKKNAGVFWAREKKSQYLTGLLKTGRCENETRLSQDAAPALFDHLERWLPNCLSDSTLLGKMGWRKKNDFSRAYHRLRCF